MNRIVVIGAGQAGASLVAKLRMLGFAGEITLIGAEPVPPYQRPPLSKAYLLGEMTLERLFLRPESFYADQGITLRLGQPVSAIDPVARTVTLGGELLEYDALALTTGSLPRHLPALIGGDLPGVHVVRALADVDAMAPEFQPGRRVVIVGGGYIGLEAAAVAAKKGLDVTVLEMAPRILQRVAAPETSDAIRALHQAHGVKILEATGLERIEGTSRVEGVSLSDGRRLAADFVIAGIGILPDTALAEAAGLEIENGIRTDAQGRTSDPHIWAAGDCASFPWRGAQLRLESVQNAIDQAELVAANMLGAGKDYAPVPWFWSDQYDLKLQIAGLNTGYDRVVLREADARSHWYFAGGKFLAVDALNDPRAYMVGKRLLEQGKSPEPALLADPATDLKLLLKA
ncbi:NAD(P)/FAD-dependent oxidoreductase [Natronohydrobacter thiooxidans]|uniref:NAD(P)/FAD-dependent oxidoreductase n=1 Tax=Natronohydrobacter thiooxidans TaxID=87172 RepID=UPI0008FF0ECB|nr:FAD-dependent oxidoreductase [Natronohydrobacter thiooxidans]